MHRVKCRNVKRNEGGKFNGDTGLMENPCKGVIKFAETEPLTKVAHYDGMDDCWVMTNEEKEALTSGKNMLVSFEFMQRLLTLGESLDTSRAIIDDLRSMAQEEGQGEK